MFQVNDNTSLQMVTHKLNGKNYLQWSQSVKLVICGKGKLGFLTGEMSAPNKTDLTYLSWVADNSIVMAWLINSMEPKIGQIFMFLSPAKALWDLTRKKYLDMGNAAQFFYLKTRIKEMKQGTMSVTQYNTESQNIWQELDLFYESDLGCEDCCLKQKRMIEKDVFEFLAGLNRELDEVHGRILSRSPFPSINDVFAKVRREEDRKQVMLGDKNNNQGLVDGSALVSHSVPVNRSNGEQWKRLWCDHCNHTRHTRDTCWKIHGKPANWTSRRQPEGRGFQA